MNPCFLKSLGVNKVNCFDATFLIKTSRIAVVQRVWNISMRMNECLTGSPGTLNPSGSPVSIDLKSGQSVTNIRSDRSDVDL